MQYTSSAQNVDLDRYALKDTNAYTEYFAYLEEVFDRVLEAYDKSLGQVSSHTNDEKKIVSDFLARVKQTIVLFSIQKLMDSERKIKIDITESGYPNRFEIQRLEADISKRKKVLSELPPLDDIVQSMQDFIFKYQKDPKKLLKQALVRSYYEKLKAKDLFFAMNLSDVIHLGLNDEETREQYMISWGYYDLQTNVPYVNILLFEDERPYEQFMDEGLESLVKSLSGENTAGITLDKVFSIIDSKTDIFPKAIKRIALGPVFGKYSADEHDVSKFLRSLKDRDVEKDFAFSLTTEVVVSSGEEYRISRLFAKKTRQNLFIMLEDQETMQKGVSEINRKLFVPSKIAQAMYDDGEYNFPDRYKIISIN